MRIARLNNLKPRPAQQHFGRILDLLPMLQATRRMIRHPQPRRLPRRRIINAFKERRNIGRQIRHRLCPGRPRRLLTPKHESVIFYRGAAPAGIYNDSVQPLAGNLAIPSFNHAASTSQRSLMTPHMLRQRPATTGTISHHHLHAQPRQQTNGRLINTRRQHRLRTSGQQRHAITPRAFGRVHVGQGGGPRRRQPRRRQIQHRPQPAHRQGVRGQQPRKRPRHARRHQRTAK